MRPIVRERIFRRDGEKCNYCGSKDNLEIDHIFPLSFGGSHSEENFQVLCRSCNRKKSNNNYFKELLNKYIILDESPDYFLVSYEFPPEMFRYPVQLTQFFIYVMKEQDKFFRKNNHYNQPL